MAKNKLYGLIFDSDGTILDSKPNQFGWLKHCVTDLYNKEFKYKKCSGEFLNDYNKAHSANGLIGVYEMLGIQYEKDKGFLWEHFNAWRRKNPPPIIKGMEETILEIYGRSRPKPGRPRGLRFLLNTSNRWPSFEKQLQESGLIKCFDTIITRDNLPEVVSADGSSTSLAKPNPYSIKWALDILGISPEEALHVGDTLEDIICCKGLRGKDSNVEHEVKVIAVTWGFETKKNLADANPYKIINNPKQLIKIIESLGGFD